MPPHKSYTVCDGISLSESAAKKLADKSLKWEERKPIGIHFNPSDQALARIFVDKFFRRSDNNVLQFFNVIEVYEHEPWNLSDMAHEFGEGKLYFFTLRRKKYRQGKNIERTAPGGFWQKTGSDSTLKIMDNSNGELIVTKTSLAFYKIDKNSGKKKKTRWLMKEYMLEIQSYENFLKSRKLDPWVLCVVYSNDEGKQKLYDERGTGSESSDDSSLIPHLNMHFPDHGNPRKCDSPFSISICHEISDSFSNNQLYPGSNPGINLQQGLPSFVSSGQNMVMGSQGATYQTSFSEPVSGTCFQLIKDLDQSLNPSINNLPNQQPHFMDDQTQTDPCEYSNSIISSPSNTIKNNNGTDQNENLDHNIDLIGWPLWSPVGNESFMPFPELRIDSWIQFGNEHESNQHMQPNSQSSSDQITQQQRSDSATLTWNPSHENPPGITPTNLQPFHYMPMFDEYDPMEIESFL